MNILEQLAAHAKERVNEKKKSTAPEEMRRRAEDIFRSGQRSLTAGKTGQRAQFEKALSGEGMHFICECKKASPSKGLIAEYFPYLQIAKDYEAAGADAISVLTEPKWFLGSDRYLQEIAQAVRIPVLRKDFTVDPYMIWEAKVLGASAVLLICSILGEEQLKEYREIADSVGLSALVEAHDAQEIAMAARAGVRILGVNNRDLKTFQVDTENAARLRSLVPDDIIFVSESGIRTPEEVSALEKAGVHAVLIGEALMREPDKRAALQNLRSLTIKGGDQMIQGVEVN